MGLTILGKKSVPLNTKSLKNPPHGVYSTNKVEKASIPVELIAYDISKHRICVLKPVIDRLVLRFNPFKGMSQSQREDYRNYIVEKLPELNGGSWSSVPVPKSEVKKNNGLYKGYTHNYWLKHEDCDEKILIQCLPKASAIPFLKFDFNPSLLGAKGVKLLKKQIDILLGKDKYAIGYDDMVKDKELVYRYDIAVDILGVDVSDMVIRYKPHGNQIVPVKSHIYKGSENRKQTEYPNALVQGNNELYIYNKKAKAIDDGHEPKFGNAHHSRFEIRYNNLKKSLFDIPKLKQNPFKKLGIHWIDYCAIAEKDFTHVMFLQYVADRGIDKALEIIPEGRSDDYKESYKSAICNIWRPEDLLACFVDAYDSYGLLK